MSPVFVTLSVLKEDVPELFVIDVLDSETLTPDTVTNRLSKRISVSGKELKKMFINDWHILMMRYKINHSDFPTRSATDINFLYTKLLRLHKKFFHP